MRSAITRCASDLEAAHPLGARAAEAQQRVGGIAGRGQARAADLTRQGGRPQVELLRVVEQHVLKAPGDRRLFADPAQGVADQIAGVARAGVGEHPLVRPVHLGELAGDRRLGGIAVAVGHLRRPPRILLGPDQLRLEPVDPSHEPAEQRIRAAAEIVSLERQLIDALEQQREPIARTERRLGGIEREAGAAEHDSGELGGRQHEQLLVAAVKRALQPAAKRVDPSGRRGQHRDPLGLASLGHEPAEAGRDHPGLAGPGRPEDDQRPTRMCDRLALSGKQAIKGVSHV